MYGILCHIAPDHMGRLEPKLVSGTQNKVYIYVDVKTYVRSFKKKLENCNNVHFLEKQNS